MPCSYITRFHNGLVLQGDQLISGDLWVSAGTGCIISPQTAFYSTHVTPDKNIDLQGKILCPGFIDVQLNGGYNFDFSAPDDNSKTNLAIFNRNLVTSGVTSYLPTVTSQLPEVYHAALPHLGPSKSRDAQDGAESLGAHVEGPFLSPARNGIHTLSVLREAHSWSDIESCYGKDNIQYIRKITAAPEVANMQSLIPKFVDNDIIFSIGHSNADLEQAQTAIAAGATMITHMFNAMRPFGHRDPGIFGLLAQSNPSTPLSSPNRSGNNSTSQSPQSRIQSQAHSRTSPPSYRLTPHSSPSISTTLSSLDLPTAPPSNSNRTPPPFFGLIADGIHLSASALKIAYTSSPSTAILVTDAMSLSGLPDGVYPWTNGERIIKSGSHLRLEKNGRIAGSAATLVECVNFFHEATGEQWARCLRCVTETPARMLGLCPDVMAVAYEKGGKKGRLHAGYDADLVVLSPRVDANGREELVVEQVWKFCVRVA